MFPAMPGGKILLLQQKLVVHHARHVRQQSYPLVVAHFRWLQYPVVSSRSNFGHMGSRRRPLSKESPLKLTG
jgi:hypothetical protein